VKKKNQRPARRRRKPALLIVDMITDFCFPDGCELFKRALPVARRIARLRDRLHAAGVPVIYVNDNFEKWHDSFATTIGSVEKSSAEGKEIVAILRPSPDDYYILKPDRSGFYKTPLDVLLTDLEVNELIITGVTTDICVLFTANDAYMRGYRVVVPSDCAASTRDAYHKQALEMLKRNAYADTRLSPWIVPKARRAKNRKHA
jgi:nicotinamidase-related amidase